MIILTLLLLVYIVYLRKKNKDLSKANRLNFDEQMRLIQEHIKSELIFNKKISNLNRQVTITNHILTMTSEDLDYFRHKYNSSSLFYHNKTNRIIQLSELTHIGDL